MLEFDSRLDICCYCSYGAYAWTAVSLQCLLDISRKPPTCRESAIIKDHPPHIPTDRGSLSILLLAPLFVLDDEFVVAPRVADGGT